MRIYALCNVLGKILPEDVGLNTEQLITTLKKTFKVAFIDTIRR